MSLCDGPRLCACAFGPAHSKSGTAAASVANSIRGVGDPERLFTCERSNTNAITGGSPGFISAFCAGMLAVPRRLLFTADGLRRDPFFLSWGRDFLIEEFR